MMSGQNKYKYYAFISYSPRDGKEARELARKLRQANYECWISCDNLNAELIPDEVFSLKTLTYFGCSTLILAIPIIGTFLAARYMLHLSAVETLGGLCCCGTCTPALNALEEETGSSVFTAAYTIPYVIGNILLTIMGSIVVEFVR